MWSIYLISKFRRRIKSRINAFPADKKINFAHRYFTEFCFEFVIFFLKNYSNSERDSPQGWQSRSLSTRFKHILTHSQKKTKITTKILINSSDIIHKTQINVASHLLFQVRSEGSKLAHNFVLFCTVKSVGPPRVRSVGFENKIIILVFRVNDFREFSRSAHNVVSINFL